MDKHIYLDVDMDYFVSPIVKVSVDNVRLYHNESSGVEAAAPAVKTLREHGLSWKAESISCFTNHKTSYTHWWISKKRDNILLHIDAHSDMYRNGSKDLRKLPNGNIQCYNYIWYGIRDEYIGEVYWVIPNSIKELMEPHRAPEIINKELISEVHRDDRGLHIIIECIVITGELKKVPVHVCTIDMLPHFDAVCHKVTLATSPEFVPASCDDFVFEFLLSFGGSKETAQNIYNQHKNMLDKTAEEIAAAWDKIGR
ncbi:MAG: hypothetical protein K0R84_1229 [Clostridia bacterium]|jgi:hypothetical protein|nr:hypothetical protein [Clostridia bacterium]